MKVITAIWLALSILGIIILAGYQSDAGAQGVAPVKWPAKSSVSRENGQKKDNTLLVFLHPQCPCSKATVHQLDLLLTKQNKKNTSAYAIFVIPKGLGSDFAQGDLYDQCRQIDGLKIVQDRDAIEANLFAARTSGQMYIYDKDGQLSFSGGITPGRGHEGDSLGLDRAKEILSTKAGQKTVCRTYGCALENEKR